MSTLTKILIVWFFGGLGAITRYGIIMWMNAKGWSADNWIALPTLIVNAVACFIIGVFAGFLYSNTAMSESTKGIFSLAAMTGFCGGFSTFSSYTLDSLKYFEQGRLNIWVIFGTVSVLLSLILCAAGYWIGKRI